MKEKNAGCSHSGINRKLRNKMKLQKRRSCNMETQNKKTGFRSALYSTAAFAYTTDGICG